MIERIELVGKCPIGALYKRVKIDIFGFIFDIEYFKELTRSWKSYTAFGEGSCGYTYSDVVFYNKKDEDGVSNFEKLIKNPKTHKQLREACGVCE